jgi:hypothetical protein
MQRSAALAFSCLLAGCGAPPSSGSEPDPDSEISPAERMAAWLTGVFDSEEQSVEEPQYFPIRLVTCPVEAPELGETAVYVEQAVMDSLESPYRQRIYVIESETSDEGASVARTLVHTLADESGAVGSCERSEREAYAPADVTLRSGCDVVSTWEPSEEAFEGSTRGEECSSSLQGATYATSEVRVEGDRLLSWDRGFAGDGAQVWGAVDGPYEFLRWD